jgi:hypothetical protein
MVIQRVKPLFEAQMTLARGTSFMFRIKENPKTGGKEHILITDPDEIGDSVAISFSGSVSWWSVAASYTGAYQGSDVFPNNEGAATGFGTTLSKTLVSQVAIVPAYCFAC